VPGPATNENNRRRVDVTAVPAGTTLHIITEPCSITSHRIRPLTWLPANDDYDDDDDDCGQWSVILTQQPLSKNTDETYRVDELQLSKSIILIVCVYITLTALSQFQVTFSITNNVTSWHV